MFPSFDTLCEAANKLREEIGDRNGYGREDPYAVAITEAKVGLALFPHPCFPDTFRAVVVKGEWHDDLLPGDWVCVYCAAADHAQAIADTYGQVGSTLSFDQAARRYDRLAHRSAEQVKARRVAMN